MRWKLDKRETLKKEKNITSYTINRQNDEVID